jgi:glycerophosphoryl diester phosphodiesterase
MVTLMKKILIILLIQIVCTHMHGHCQYHDRNFVYLTNYTIGKETNIVGNIKVKAGAIKSITVAGENKAAFKINKNHQLIVLPEKLQPQAMWYDVQLTIKTSSDELSRVFRIVKDDFIRNKVIAHRGAWKNTGATENSIAALNHAIELGCEGSEFDVHMSADALPVVNHDPAIHGISIAKTNSSELLKLKLANGETLATLEDYLKAGVKQNKTKLILEIKPSELGTKSSLALTRKIIAIVEKFNAQAWVDYISFDYDVCKEVMKLAPYAKVAYLKGDKTPAELAADRLFGLDYNYTVLEKNPRWLQEAKNKNLTINVWTVNDPAKLKELLEKDVDFITTNEPELLLSMVK